MSGDEEQRVTTQRKVSFLQVAGFVWSYWRRLWFRFALIVAGALGAVFLEVQVPARAADLMQQARNYAAGEAEIEVAWTAMAGLLGVFAAVFCVHQATLRLWMYFASEIMQQMVSDGFHRVQRFSAEWHSTNFAGSTVRKITRGMWAYDQFADTVVIELGPALALLFGFSIAMIVRDPLTGLYFAGAVTIFVASSVVMSLAYVAPANQRSNDADTEVGGRLADSVTCNSVVKSFGAEDREDGRLLEAAGTWRVLARSAWTRSMDAGAVQSLLILALLGGLLAIVLWQFGRGAAGLDDIVYAITLYFIVNGYMRNIGWQLRNLQRAVNELDDLVEISQTDPQVRDAPNARRLEPGSGAIAFERVTFKYENQPSPLFNGLSIEIEPGERVALVGESGSGKSSFVKLLQRLHDVEAGRVSINGHDIAKVTQQSLRRVIALVPQEPILFHRTLHENIAYGLPGASRDQVIDASRKAHAHEFIGRLTQNYDTLVGERGIKLSGGERQRVAIARAILADAPILVLDEATSSLDSITEQLIRDAIEVLMGGRTSILIAHRLSTVRRVDRILVFDRGRIIEQGTHDLLMAKPQGAYRRMFEMQTLGFIDEEPMTELA